MKRYTQLRTTQTKSTMYLQPWGKMKRDHSKVSFNKRV